MMKQSFFYDYKQFSYNKLVTEILLDWIKSFLTSMGKDKTCQTKLQEKTAEDVSLLSKISPSQESLHKT